MGKKRGKAKKEQRSLVPHLIAGFVLFHTTASCLAVIPDVGAGLDRRAWRDPRVEREMAAWSARLGVERSALEEQLYELAVDYQRARSALRAPFDPYLDAAGITQSWPMFIAGTAESHRFAVHVHRCDPECEWSLAFLHGDPDHAWRRHLLAHPRVRSAIFRWTWPAYRGRYERGCRTIARLALEDFEDADAVRCSFETTTTRSPSSPSPPPPTWTRAIVVHR